MEWVCLVCEKKVEMDPQSTGSMKPACWPCVAGGTVSIHFGWFSRFDDMNGIGGRGVTHQAVICDDCYEKKQHLTRPVVPRSTTEWRELPLDYRGEPAADSPDFIRAGGDAVCAECQKAYHSHPQHSEFSFLNVLCDGTVVKL